MKTNSHSFSYSWLENFPRIVINSKPGQIDNGHPTLEPSAVIIL